jgi:hypothetical protein
MTKEHNKEFYSFSMVNCLKLMPQWDWQAFGTIMELAGTSRVELVPGFLFGSDWDNQITSDDDLKGQLDQLKKCYCVTSIQSLTFGLEINLGEPLVGNPSVRRRFIALAELGKQLACDVFVLGSPGQKKLSETLREVHKSKDNFIANCSWFASLLSGIGILSLEHNTIKQGAEFCNTLGDIIDAVLSVRGNEISNIGINLDTKCLIHEFGDSFRLTELLYSYKLHPLICSIQVSLDFLERSCAHQDQDVKALLDVARAYGLPISLEEFGLENQQLERLTMLWNSHLVD